MTEVPLRNLERPRPLVAVICAIPLLGEAMMAALEFAEVRTFSERGGDIAGLLEWLSPDAVVVDSEDSAAAATEHAARRGVPLVHIGIRERKLRLLHQGEWHPITSDEGPTPEILRNVVAGALFGREGLPAA